MTEQLSIHSTRAVDIAERLARQESRSVTEIVERAPEAMKAAKRNVSQLQCFTLD